MYSHRSIGLGGGLIAFVGGAVLWALFGDKIKEKMNRNEDWIRLKSEVENRARQAKDMTQDAYNKIVDEVTDVYSRTKGISKNEFPGLIEDLKRNWYKIKTAWNKDSIDQI